MAWMNSLDTLVVVGGAAFEIGTEGVEKLGEFFGVFVREDGMAGARISAPREKAEVDLIYS